MRPQGFDRSNLLFRIRQSGGSTAVVPPIGTIMAWHKSMTGTPALPSEWLECNGQTVSDALSPYDGQALPDLNNPPTGYNGGRFLRGNTTSGTMQEGSSIWQNDTSDTVRNSDGDANVTPATVDAHTSSTPYSALGVNAVRPLNMSVVWIMRIK